MRHLPQKGCEMTMADRTHIEWTDATCKWSEAKPTGDELK